MKIKFLGAAGTVTGSSYVLTSDAGQSILIDLGMFQGTPEIDKLNYEPFEFDCSQLYAAILTHAHLDHCGRLPIILPKGFRGDIWMTPPTRDLTEISLLDSANIAKKERNKILYDRELVIETMNRVRTMEYREQQAIGDFLVTMRDAGHILGSAMLEIVDTTATGEMKKIVFSGDLGNPPPDLVESTEFIESADAVVMESTYGDRLHPDTEAIDILQKEINAVESSNGALLIPAFSLERSQELLHLIMHLKMSGKMSMDTAVYLDSPMAVRATEIYLQYIPYFNDHIQEEESKSGAFEFPGLQITIRRDQSEDIHDKYGPKVIIAGGGMMTGGRIVGHAAYYLPYEQNRLLLVGYQGEETLGREIMEGARRVIINEKVVNIKASVEISRSMSSHADQSQLLDWLGHIKGVKKLFLTHGEEGPRTVLAETVREKLGIQDIVLPLQNEEHVV